MKTHKYRYLNVLTIGILFGSCLTRLLEALHHKIIRMDALFGLLIAIIAAVIFIINEKGVE